MFDGTTATYLVLCSVLVVGLAGAFWFTVILPRDRRPTGKRENHSAQG